MKTIKVSERVGFEIVEVMINKIMKVVDLAILGVGSTTAILYLFTLISF